MLLLLQDVFTAEAAAVLNRRKRSVVDSAATNSLVLVGYVSSSLSLYLCPAPREAQS